MVADDATTDDEKRGQEFSCPLEHCLTLAFNIFANGHLSQSTDFRVTVMGSPEMHEPAHRQAD